MIADVEHDHAPQDLLPLLSHLDIVLAEGFKRAIQPKIEVFRPEVGKDGVCRDDPHLLALVSNAPVDWGVPRFATDEIEGLADFLMSRLRLRSGKVVNLKPSS